MGVNALKKICILYIFPAITAVLFFTFKGSFADFAARTTLWLLNPVQTAQYVVQHGGLSSAADSSFLPHGDTAEKSENPFEDFDFSSQKP